MISSVVLQGAALSALIAISIPFVVYFALRRRMELRARNIFVGVATFVVVVIVLEATLHAYLLQTNGATKAWFASNPWGMAVYAAAAAALFEETGRYFALRFLAKPVAGSGTPVAYGIGHAGAECFLIAINIGVIVALGYLIMTGQAESLKLGNDTIGTITNSLSGGTFATSLLGGAERIIAFVFQVAFSLLIWQAVRTGRFGFYLMAVLFHFAVDLPAAMLQQKLLPLSLIELEGAYALLAILVLAGIWTFAPRSAPAT